MNWHHVILCFPTMILITLFFFFNDTATTEIYTLSLHDALPILSKHEHVALSNPAIGGGVAASHELPPATSISPISRLDRKSTRLNSSHGYISYAVFCLKKKKNELDELRTTTV